MLIRHNMKNKEILTVIKGLSELEELDIPLKIKTSYLLARNRQILTPFADIINEQQIELYKKHGHKTENNTYKVSNEKIPDLEKDLNELLEIENKVQIVKLKLSDFGDNDIPFGVVEKLLPIIIEE